MTTSKHYLNERGARQDAINALGEGEPVRSFEWAYNGEKQRHTLTSTGIIIVYNPAGKLITKLIARPGQINRYYKAIGEKPPRELMKLAGQHEAEGLNFR